MKIKEDILQTLIPHGVVTQSNLVIGAQVRRGPDWAWWDQDRGRDGVIIEKNPYFIGWVRVKWTGSEMFESVYSYRIGAQGRYDLIYV